MIAFEMCIPCSRGTRICDCYDEPSDTPASAAKGEAMTEADKKWLLEFLDGFRDMGHCGEGNVEWRTRKDWNDRIYRLLAALQPHSSHQAGTEDYAGLVNAAVDDLTIAPHWHTGLSRAETELVQAAFQNGVEVAADAILAALTSEAKG